MLETDETFATKNTNAATEREAALLCCGKRYAAWNSTNNICFTYLSSGFLAFVPSPDLIAPFFFKLRLMQLACACSLILSKIFTVKSPVWFSLVVKLKLIREKGCYYSSWWRAINQVFSFISHDVVTSDVDSKLIHRVVKNWKIYLLQIISSGMETESLTCTNILRSPLTSAKWRWNNTCWSLISQFSICSWGFKRKKKTEKWSSYVVYLLCCKQK